VLRYRPVIWQFLDERFGAGPVCLRDMAPSDASRFLVRHAGSVAPGSASLMVTALRSFFRFLFQHDEIEADLAAAVPGVARWRLSTVPKYLRPEEVDAVLAACDRSTAVGRRDYAIVLLLARLGLRAGEVVALELEDLYWRVGEITVRGKGCVHHRLPLVPEVGEAIAAYLRRDRPASRSRRVFLRTRAPHRGFAGPVTVSTLVRRAVERAGLEPPSRGAHLLRHSLATGMLRRGASMSEIAELLRHQALGTTEIYAKVDLGGLSSLAQPWPSTGGGR
jgi:integrase